MDAATKETIFDLSGVISRACEGKTMGVSLSAMMACIEAACDIRPELKPIAVAFLLNTSDKIAAKAIVEMSIGSDHSEHLH